MIKLFRFLKPYRMQIIFVLLFVFLQSLSDLYLPTLMAHIVDTGIVKGDTSYILQVGGFMLLIAVGGVICSVLASYFSSITAMGFGKIIRGEIFDHVEQFSLHEFNKISTASLITRTTNDTTQVQQVLIIMLRMMVSAPMMCIGGIIMAVAQDAPLSWVFAVALPIVIVTILSIIGRATPLFQLMQKKIDKLNLILDEGLTGVRVIRAFDRTDYERRRFDEANLSLTDTAITVNRTISALMPLMMLIMNVSTLAIFWFGALRIDSGSMQVGSLMAFLQYALQIMFSLLMLSMLAVMLPRAAASAERINEVLAIVPEIKDAETVKEPNRERGYVEFRDVTFRYPGAEEPAIANISFSARPGEVTAIIGGTGAGKSTLVSLIPRFYDIEQGSILVDGVDIRELAQEALRARIGFVPQKAVLFSGTISENIRYGKKDATLEEVQHAATIAQASGFISGMPDGYDAVIAQGGANVSGGQKQRLSIARALVRKPEIYIFDDSFSALDFRTDARLRAALKDETRTSTVFIVAQRVSTVMDADRIIVLDEGRIAGIGTHRELMKTCEVYREIVSSQLSPEEVAS
jgi:ATP-binding cassette subfamily B multidrug efflux pump